MSPAQSTLFLWREGGREEKEKEGGRERGREGGREKGREGGKEHIP